MAPLGSDDEHPAPQLVHDATPIWLTWVRACRAGDGVGGRAELGYPLFRACRLGAICHDLRRESDGYDLQHGFRAGEWVRTVLPTLLREMPADAEQIASACDWHVCRDADSEWDHPVLWRLKDADNLDRVRLYDLDPEFLRHPETIARIGDAQELMEPTDHANDLAIVWQAAREMGLPVEPLFTLLKQIELTIIGKLH